MKKIISFIVLVVIAVTKSHAEVNKDDFLNKARATYYSPQEHGLISFSCQVKPDWTTIPTPMLPEAATQERSILKQTKFQVTIKNRGNPDFSHEYPTNQSTASLASVEPISRFISSIVLGFFQTWMTKGFDTPFPPFTKMIGTVTPDSDGYKVLLDVPGGPVTLHATNDYLVTLIQSGVGGKTIEEHPSFDSTSEGRLFNSMDAFDRNGQSATHIQYELTHKQIDGINIPSQIRMRVNDNVDVRFELDQCSITKGVVVHVAPTPNK